MTTDEVFKDFKIMANKKILKNHKYEIYYSESEKSWRTYLPDETKPNKRRPVKRKSKENLEKEIIRFYIEKLKAVRMSHWKNYMLNGFCIKEIILP